MRTITYDMKQLLVEAKRGAFVVPRFQRDFKWHQAQVKLLIDSIARNYPMGSLLLLVENDTRNPFLASRPVQAVIQNDERTMVDEISGKFYVLDGQQRLTSIVRVFLQASPEGQYYFDLKVLMHFDDDAAATKWVVFRKTAKPMTKRYLKSDAILDRERCQVLVEEYFETDEPSLKNDRPSQRAASAKVNRIFETIRNYQVPLVVIDRDESLEAICRIFETINSTGTRLTTFDLAVARFFPNPDLHSKWEYSIREYPILEKYDIDGERVLQVIAVKESLTKGSYPETTRAALLGLDRKCLLERWDNSIHDLAEAYRWAEERGMAPKMVGNPALMVPLAVFLSSIDDAWKKTQPGFSAHLERWYYASCLQQGAKQASNYRVAESTAELMKWRMQGVAPMIQYVSLTSESILKLRPADSRYRAILSFLRWRMKIDLWTAEPLTAIDVEDHHIFPAVNARRNNIDKQILDSIGNRILVTTSTNRSLGDRLPQDYMGQLLFTAKMNGSFSQTISNLKLACIDLPEDIDSAKAELDISKAIDFVRRRAELIHTELKRFLGESMVDTIPGNDDEEDDDF